MKHKEMPGYGGGRSLDGADCRSDLPGISGGYSEWPDMAEERDT